MTRNRIKSAPRSGGRAPRESTRAAHQGLLVASLVAGFGCAGGTSGEMESATAGTTGGEMESATAAETETGSSGMNTDDPDPSRPFEPITPAAALHKVKTFLVGIAPTSAEYAAYAEDPEALSGMIDAWMALPEFEPRVHEMLAFMFQQGASSDDIGLLFREQNTDIFQQREGRGGVDLEGPMRRSWSLTAWDIIAESRPFTEVATTRTYYLNVPLMMAMAYVDATPRDDANRYVAGYSRLEQAYPDFEVSYTQDEMIPFSESVDPDSPNFGRFTIGEPDGSAAGTSTCDGLKDTFSGRAAIEEVYKTMMGVPFRTTCWSWNGAMANVFSAEDHSFRRVKVRLPEPGETPTVFWDLETLRGASELVLDTEYVGFFGTMGFLGQWTTNSANEYRVTANQALIVALGRSFDPSGSNAPIDDVGDNTMHAEPGTECYGCHVTLDPLRDFFRQSYTYWGSRRVEGMGENEVIPAQATFAIEGSDPVQGVGVGDLGAALAGSERFAAAWAEKMCGLVNVGMCVPEDPELQRIAKVFAASDHDFRVLVRELLTSPIVTYQERTQTWEERGAAVGAALQDDLCRRLTHRTGIDDACALADELAVVPGDREIIAGYAGVIAAMGYPRGAVAPEQPVVPTLFSTSGAESLCEALASRFVGGGGPIAYTAGEREAAIAFFLSELMGVWSDDPRAGALKQVLDEHWDAVLAAGESEEMALQSTFTLACSAPQTTSTGL
jgi:hypothetical protein